MKRILSLIAALFLAILVGGCGGQGTSADAPPDLRVVAGDAAVTLTWTAEPDVDYWIFYGPGDSITTANWSTTGGRVITNATSPRVITGFVNGNTYSFTINGRKNGGPGGPGAPTQVAVPRLSGVTWTAGAPLGSGKLTGVTAGTLVAGYTTIAVGEGGSIYASVDGSATTTPTNPSAPADLNAVWFATAGLVAAGANGTVLTSTDATTWTAQASGTTATLRGGSSTGVGGFVAVGDGGAIITSGTGATWAPVTSNTANNLYAAAYGVGLYVAVGASGTIVTSPDTLTWTTVAPVTSADLRGVTFGLVSTTTDGVTTTANLFVAVGAAGTLLTSADGGTWTVQAPISTSNLAAVVYGGQFMAVGSGGGIFSSSDGISWTARTSGTTNDLTAVVRNLSGYSVVGNNGTNLVSY